MTFVLITAALILAVALVHLTVGWVLANGLHIAALEVSDRPAERGVWVRGFSGRTITLTAREPRQDIGHPGRTAIVFDGGSGKLGDVLDVDSGLVTRAVLEMSDSPPICEGDLDDCPPVELNGYYFLGDPSELGLDYSEAHFDSELGQLGGWLVEGTDAAKWAVHVHGWTAHRQEMLRMQPVFHAGGFNSLIIDYRNDPGAPKDPTGRYGWGLTEWRDLEAAVQMTLDRGASDIVLSGCSTGGAIVLAFLENSKLASRVQAVVLDAPNAVLSEAIRHATRDTRATALMIEFGMWIADLRWKIDWDRTNFVERSREFLDVPALVFHGTSDQRVPIAVSRRLAALNPTRVELHEVPAAGHVMSWNADPDRYERTLEEFLGRL